MDPSKRKTIPKTSSRARGDERSGGARHAHPRRSTEKREGGGLKSTASTIMAMEQLVTPLNTWPVSLVYGKESEIIVGPGGFPCDF